MILQDRGWQNRSFTELDYAMVEDRAADVAEEKLSSVLRQLHEKRTVIAKESDMEKIRMPGAEKKPSEECL